MSSGLSCIVLMLVCTLACQESVQPPSFSLSPFTLTDFSTTYQVAFAFCFFCKTFHDKMQSFSKSFSHVTEKLSRNRKGHISRKGFDVRKIDEVCIYYRTQHKTPQMLSVQLYLRTKQRKTDGRIQKLHRCFPLRFFYLNTISASTAPG